MPSRLHVQHLIHSKLAQVEMLLLLLSSRACSTLHYGKGRRGTQAQSFMMDDTVKCSI